MPRPVAMTGQEAVNMPSTNIFARGKTFPWNTPKELNEQDKNGMIAKLVQEMSPLFWKIWNGPLSTSLRNEIQNDPGEFWERMVKYVKNGSEERMVLTNFHTFSYQDRAPLDMSTACCNVPFTMQHCNREFEFKPVCDIECRGKMEKYIEEKRVSSRFANEEDGHIIKNQMSRDFNLLLSFTFDRIRHSIVGTNNTTSDGLGQFNGIKQFADSQYTVNVIGGNIIATLEYVRCRMEGINFDAANTVLAFPTRLKLAFNRAVARDRSGNMYEGISNQNGTYYFNGVEVVFDDYVDYILSSGQGTALLLELNHVAIVWGLPTMAIPMEFLNEDSDAFRTERRTHYAYDATITNTAGQCFNECRAISDYGTALVTDYNYIMKISQIQNSNRCTAAVFEGTEQSIAPATPTLN